MVAKLPAMTSRHRHLCNPRRVCAKRNLKRKNLIFWSLSVKPVYFPTIGTVFSYMPRAFIIIIIINPLTARVVGAPQMILQPVVSFFSLFSTALWDLPNSMPIHSLMLSSHLFLCPPCLLPPFTVPYTMILARPDARDT